MAGDTVKHYLDQTDIDDQVYGKVTEHFGTARAVTVDMMGKVASIDYKEHLNSLTQHDVYKTHIAPTMDAVHKTAQPYVKEYVNPALEKVYGATKHMNENMIPEVQGKMAMVNDHVNPNVLMSKAGRIIDPIYVAAGKASPKLARVFPSDTWDRILLLVVGVISFYYFLSTTYFLTRKGFWVTRKTTSFAITIFVVLPLWLIWKAVRLVLCLTTCGFCCGICSRRQATENGKNEKNGKNGKEDKKEQKKLTDEEINQLLQKSKSKGKLEEAVKVLVTRAKDGKPLTGKQFPENVVNRSLDVATLKKALAKHKEIDLKKVGL